MTLYDLHLHRCADRADLGDHAGRRAADLLGEALAERGSARVMLAAAPSQQATLTVLAASGLDFSRVEFFHMDDYLGLSPDAPQGFGNWLQTHFIDLLDAAGTFHRMEVQGGDHQAAAQRYDDLMGTEPFDVTLCGLGVNGHLAFNDPPARFDDPSGARVVELDQVSRQQQVDEGHFPDLDAVPSHAVTVTIPRLLNARHVICSVPGAEKRDAVTQTVVGALDPMHPGTALKTHPDVHLFVDAESAPETDDE